MYYIRTHCPVDSHVTNIAFEKRSLQALCSMLGIDVKTLTPENILAIQLPQRFGGLGLALPVLIAQPAHESSTHPEEASQADKCEVLYKEWADILSNQNQIWKETLAEQAKKNASRWIFAGNANNPHAYRNSILHHIRFVPPSPKTVHTCPSCKTFKGSLEQILDHSLGCSPGSRNFNPRHTAIVHAIRTICSINGISCRNEVALDEKGELRMDNVIATDGKLIYNDVTVVNVQCKTHLGKASQAMTAVKNLKKKTYSSAANADEAELQVFSLSSLGDFTNNTKTVLKEITSRGPITFDDAREMISTTLAEQNGIILGSTMKRLGIKSQITQLASEQEDSSATAQQQSPTPLGTPHSAEEDAHLPARGEDSAKAGATHVKLSTTGSHAPQVSHALSDGN
jgi:hypothetical protein